MTARSSAVQRVGVGVLAAAVAAGFVRTTDGETSACLSWPSREVTFVVNPSRPDSSPSCDGDGALVAARRAFAAWPGATSPRGGAPCTDLRLVDGGVTDRTEAGFLRGGANENLVVFRRGWCSERADVAADDPCWDDGSCGDVYGCFPDEGESDRSIIAITTVTYEPRSGRIFDADIEVADWDGRPGALSPAANGWYFTCGEDVAQCGEYEEDGCTYIDLENTLTHEVGHFLGLAHVPRTSVNRAVTMYPETEPLDLSKRDLSADDVAGVCAIYPDGASTPACTRDRDGGCGGETAPGPGPGAAVGLGLAVLVLAFRRLRRRRAQETTTPA